MKVMILLPLLTLVALCEGSQFWASRRINCGVSAWSDWSSPANGGLQTRSRTILRHPRNGGTACPSLVETRETPRGTLGRADGNFMTGLAHHNSRVLGVDGHRSRVLSRGGGNFMTGLAHHNSRVLEVDGHRSRVLSKGGGNFMTGLAHHNSRVLEVDGHRSRVLSRDGPLGRSDSNFMTGLAHHNSRVLGVDEHRSIVLSRGGEDGLTLLPRDLLLIIDMSGSINESQWSMLKSKIADLVEGICGGIGSGRQSNRIAAITFSNRIVLNFNFKTHFSFASLRRAILLMPQVRGSTCTGDAFSYANEHLFKPSAGMRSSAESVKEVLVITDGRSNCGADVIRSVRMLQVKAFVFVLAVGNYGDRGRLEIESLVSRPLTNHIFSIANFLQFKEMVEIILDIPENCAPFELS